MCAVWRVTACRVCTRCAVGSAHCACAQQVCLRTPVVGAPEPAGGWVQHALVLGPRHPCAIGVYVIVFTNGPEALGRTTHGLIAVEAPFQAYHPKSGPPGVTNVFSASVPSPQSRAPLARGKRGPRPVPGVEVSAHGGRVLLRRPLRSLGEGCCCPSVTPYGLHECPAVAAAQWRL